MSTRQKKGLLIAQRSRIKKTDRGWRVTSQTKHTYYLVYFSKRKGRLVCNCADYQETEMPCKHIYGVQFASSGNLADMPKDVKIKRVTYPQKWSAYDAAKTHEKEWLMDLLNELCRAVPIKIQSYGRPQNSIQEMIFASCLKVYSGFSLRRFIPDIRIAKEKGYVSSVPCYSAISHFMQNERLTPILEKMILISSLPLSSTETEWSTDSSGFSTSQFGRWFDHRYGKEQKKRKWLKLNIICGNKTNVIPVVTIREGYASDEKEFCGLVERLAINFKIDEISADKAYSSIDCMKIVMKVGGVAYIPFKSNASATAAKSKIWKKALEYFKYKKEEFNQKYHKRSNVEATFSMAKRLFDGYIRSTNETAQINEFLLKVLCHNICVLIQEIHELGIKAEFKSWESV